MDNIYIVTKGSYSDYHIIAVFKDKAIAEETARIFTDKYDEAVVEEWKFNITKPKIYSWFCRISKKTGEIISCENWESEIEQSKGTDVGGNYFAMGSTKEEAIKNASDFRGYELAKEQNLT